jgi:ABC-type dipeptide/oligopeptide/nickel transport system permease component
MVKYLIRRTLWIIPVFLAVTLITSVFMHLLPGDPFSSERLGEVDQAKILSAYGLDQPWYIQYLIYVWNFVRGDWGVSFQQLGRPVSTIIGEHIGYSLTLAVIATLATAALGIPLGIIAALNHNRLLDYLVTAFALFLYSIPGFILAIMALLLILLANSTFGWNMPLTKSDPGVVDLIIPGIILGVRPASIVMRLTRSNMLEVLHQEYMRAARAKGLSRTRMIIHHALKNVLTPVVTVLGDELGSMAVGSVAIETIFGIPGMGSYLVASIRARDYPMILAITVLYAMIVVIINLLVDVIYGFLDPRIKYHSGKRHR